VIEKTFGTDRRGATALFGIGAAIGLILAVAVFLSYGIGAGYVAAIQTPWNLFATLGVLVLTVVLCVALLRRAGGA
jgi:hypothetical protein